MKIIRKTNICSFRANNKSIGDSSIDGLHFITKSGFTFDRESVNKHIYTKKPIIYETSNDETSSYDYTIYNLMLFKKRFPNMIVSLEDYKMALNIREMLGLEGQELKVSTPVTGSLEGDYIEYSHNSLASRKGEIERTNVSKMLELLREKKKLILDYEAFKDTVGVEVLDELERKTQGSDDIFISTWTPKRILK